MNFVNFRGHNGTVWSMVASGDRMYSSCSDGSIKMWDVADMRRGCMKTIVAHSDYVSAHSWCASIEVLSCR